MKDSFYSAFENKYRGSRELIKSRLQVYVPIISKLLTLYPNATVLDLGCGRGEWLEVVKSLGFQERGVDLDEGMLRYCYENGLNAEHKNALDVLRELPDNSVTVVSSFHLVEHIGFDNVNMLVKEALRVLNPGGLLIMETPNPENIIVSTNNFYLDPTHDKPIPRQLLSFLTEYAGFERTTTLRLQESDDIEVRTDIELYDVFQGVSPDYSIVAQKSGDPEFTSEFESFFQADFGVSLEFLAKKFSSNINGKLENICNEIISLDKRIDSRIEEKMCEMVESNNILNTKISSLDTSNQNISDNLIKLNKANADIKRYTEEVESLKMQIEEFKHIVDGNDSEANNVFLIKKLMQCQDELQKASEMLLLMRASNSWRVTSPLRYLSGTIKKIRSKRTHPFSIFKAIIIRFISFIVRFLNKRPALRNHILKISKKIGAYNSLRSLYQRLHLSRNIVQVTELNTGDNEILDAELSAHGKEILNNLNR